MANKLATMGAAFAIYAALIVPLVSQPGAEISETHIVHSERLRVFV